MCVCVRVSCHKSSVNRTEFAFGIRYCVATVASTMKSEGKRKRQGDTEALLGLLHGKQSENTVSFGYFFFFEEFYILNMSTCIQVASRSPAAREGNPW